MCVHTSEENETIAESNSPARASAESAIRLYLYFTFYQRTRARGPRRAAGGARARRTADACSAAGGGG